MFAMAYDANGRMVGNIVLALTDQGVVIYGDYNWTALNMAPVWAEAWRRLARVAPAVILDEKSAGRRDMLTFGDVQPLKVERRKSLWNSPYFDFGTVKDGKLLLDLKQALVATQSSIEA